MKRISLFLLTNVLMLVTLGFFTHLICLFFGKTLDELVGPEWSWLVIFAAVYGFFGAFFSLLISKPMAKLMCGAWTINGTEGEQERWLVATIEELARRANVKMPEVAIYHGAANAFATGAFKHHALVAVSTEIMEQMTKEELRAVLGHELSHIANGDMVTMTLVQGVLNAFVIFFSRAFARILSANGKRSSGQFYFILVWVFDLVLGTLASLLVLAYSRRREYTADAGSARLLGSPSAMIAALRRLGNLQPGILPDSLKAMGIAGRRTSFLSTHPALEDRIAALQNLHV